MLPAARSSAGLNPVTKLEMATALSSVMFFRLSTSVIVCRPSKNCLSKVAALIEVIVSATAVEYSPRLIAPIRKLFTRSEVYARIDA